LCTDIVGRCTDIVGRWGVLARSRTARLLVPRPRLRLGAKIPLTVHFVAIDKIVCLEFGEIAVDGSRIHIVMFWI
jgi:hypothetical protein